jgi:subtilisin family serine protease
MYQKKLRQFIAAVLSVAVILGQSQTAYAVGSDLLEEELLEEFDADVSENDSEEVFEEDLEESLEEEFLILEETEDESNPDNTYGYTLSKTEKEIKNDLASHLEYYTEFETLTEGEDYATNEVVCLADSKEHAERIAKAYGGELQSFSYGIATINLEDSDLSVATAYSMAFDPSLVVPAVEPNFIRRHFDDADPQFADKIMETSNGSYDAVFGKILDDPYLSVEAEEYQYHHDIIGSFDAWRYTTGNRNIVVAVIDSGVTGSHSEFASKLIGNWNGNSTTDLDGHGTHCAGIIGAAGNNGIGGAGVAPDVSILPLCVDEDGYMMDDLILAAYRYIAGYDESGKKVTKRRADITSMSYGGEHYSAVENKAIQQCIASGVTMVAAMGNDNANYLCYPAGYSNVIGVAAVDQNSNKASFSTFGSWCDISAPGVRIYSTLNASSGYQDMSGTSMACPVVAGACALYMSYVGHVSPKQMEKVLKANATKINDTGMGAGIVNIGKMIRSTSKAKKSGIPSTKVVKTGIKVSGHGIISPGSSATFKVSVTPSKKKLGKVTWQLQGQPDGVKISSKGVVTVPKNAPATKDVVVIATATVKNEGTYTETAVFSIAPKNKEIFIYADTKTIATAKVGDYKTSALLTATCDSDDSAVKWSSSNPKIAKVSGKGSTAVVTALKSGTVTITANANDGGKAKASVKIKVVTPASSFGIAPNNRQRDTNLATGGTLQFKPVFGTLYGPVSNKKVTWEYRYMPYNSDNQPIFLSENEQDQLKKAKAFVSFKDGKLMVKSTSAYNADLKKYSDITHGAVSLGIEVSANTTDRSYYSATNEVYIQEKITSVTFGSPNAPITSKTMKARTSMRLYYNIKSSGYYDVDFEIVSSNPKVCSACQYYDNSIWVRASKKGTATLTLKAHDGSGTIGKLKIKVK